MAERPAPDGSLKPSTASPETGGAEGRFWAARDRGGELNLFVLKPVRYREEGAWVCEEDADCLPLDRSCFPALTWHDEPRQVFLVLREDAPEPPPASPTSRPSMEGDASQDRRSASDARGATSLGLLVRVKALRDEVDEYARTLAAISSSRTSNAARIKAWAARALAKFGRLPG